TDAVDHGFGARVALTQREDLHRVAGLDQVLRLAPDTGVLLVVAVGEHRDRTARSSTGRAAHVPPRGNRRSGRRRPPLAAVGSRTGGGSWGRAAHVPPRGHRGSGPRRPPLAAVRSRMAGRHRWPSPRDRRPAETGPPIDWPPMAEPPTPLVSVIVPVYNDVRR